jgi:hypothetical protein
MKKLLCICAGLAVVLSIGAFAQDNAGMGSPTRTRLPRP